VIFYPNWQCAGIGQVVHYTKTAGNHTLRFEFGDQTAFAYNSYSPITIVQQKPATITPDQSVQWSSSGTVSFSSLPAEGNLIVVVVTENNGYGLEGITRVYDNKGNGNYTLAVTRSTSLGHGTAAIYYKNNIGKSSGTFSVTVTFGNNTAASIGLYEIRGADKYDPCPPGNTNNSRGSGTTASAGSVTPFRRAFYVALMTGDDDGTSFTSIATTTGWTGRWAQFFAGDDYSAGMFAEDLISTGSTTATWTIAPSQPWVGVIAAFNEGGHIAVTNSNINPATTFFTSNWEGESTILDGKWTGESGTVSGYLSLDKSRYLDGTRSLYYNYGSNDDFVYKTLSPAKSTVGVRFAINIKAVPSDFLVLNIRDNSGYGNMVVVVITTTNIQVYNEGSASYIGTGYTFSLNTWYQVEVVFTNNTIIKWRVWDATGRNLVKAEQSTSTSVPNSNCDLFEIGGLSGPGGTAQFYFDTVALSSTGYPGPYIPRNAYINTPEAKIGPATPMALWSFDGPDISWTSNLAYDRASSNNLTITGMQAASNAVPGVSGQGLYFDGSNDYLVKASMNFNGSGAYTYSAWLKYTPEVGSYADFLDSSNGSCDTSSAGCFIFFDIGSSGADCPSGKLQLSLYNSGYDSNCYNRPTAGWHHFAAIWDMSQPIGYEISLYIDGVAQATSSQPLKAENSGNFAAGNVFALMYQPYLTTYQAAGILDEARLYSRALTASEIQQLYLAGSRRAKITK
jgi:hypothetical protein